LRIGTPEDENVLKYVVFVMLGGGVVEIGFRRHRSGGKRDASVYAAACAFDSGAHHGARRVRMGSPQRKASEDRLATRAGE
jgi:hypothetical protein